MLPNTEIYILQGVPVILYGIRQNFWNELVSTSEIEHNTVSSKTHFRV